MTLQEKLYSLKKTDKAVLAANFYNFETLKGILEAAQSCNQPVILQLTQSSIDYMGLQNAVSMAKTGLDFYKVQGWIHLDHANNLELVEACLKSGFDSIMFDGSELPFDENIKLTKIAVKSAQKYNANVEAELGYVAKLGQDSGKVQFTQTNEAKVFVEETGINALAVAIGTVHGFYKSKPELNFERLSELNEVLDIPLVMHGASGIPKEDVRKAVSLGICKVNIATEIKNTFILNVKKILSETDNIDLRTSFPVAIEAVKILIKDKFNYVN